jgi:hypothetical protein
MIDQKVIDDILRERVKALVSIEWTTKGEMTDEERVIFDRGRAAYWSLKERYPDLELSDFYATGSSST